MSAQMKSLQKNVPVVSKVLASNIHFWNCYYHNHCEDIVSMHTLHPQSYIHYTEAKKQTKTSHEVDLFN